VQCHLHQLYYCLLTDFIYWLLAWHSYWILKTAKLYVVCQDVSIKPVRQPLNGESIHYRTVNTREDTRLDISARVFWKRAGCQWLETRCKLNTSERQPKDLTGIWRHICEDATSPFWFLSNLNAKSSFRTLSLNIFPAEIWCVCAFEGRSKLGESKRPFSKNLIFWNFVTPLPPPPGDLNMAKAAKTV